MKVKSHEAYILVPFFLFIGIVTLYSIFNFEKVYFMFNGLGIFGTAAHSSGARWSEFGDTLRAFWKSPIIGYSLGGIPSAIAEVRGIMITTQFQAKSFEGMNIFAEVLAASGIFGFVCFMLFLIQLFRKTYQLSEVLNEVDNSFGNLMKALLLSLFFELLILNMNQNILRPYLWVHIAIINLSYIIGKQILLNKNLTQKSIEDHNH